MLSVALYLVACRAASLALVTVMSIPSNLFLYVCTCLEFRDLRTMASTVSFFSFSRWAITRFALADMRCALRSGVSFAKRFNFFCESLFLYLLSPLSVAWAFFRVSFFLNRARRAIFCSSVSFCFFLAFLAASLLRSFCLGVKLAYSGSLTSIFAEKYKIRCEFF